MGKLDFKKIHKELYKANTDPVLVDVPVLNYVMIDGYGDPNTTVKFTEAVEALYGFSFTLKMTQKQEDPSKDWVVMPLEGLWWSDDMADFTRMAKEKWQWTLMILQPDFISPEMMTPIKEKLKKKKINPSVDDLRFGVLHEGLSLQILHIGPYTSEGPTIEKLHRFACDNGYFLHDKHHEIYLSDPRRTAPERLKTIIRQPIAK